MRTLKPALALCLLLGTTQCVEVPKKLSEEEHTAVLTAKDSGSAGDAADTLLADVPGTNDVTLDTLGDADTPGPSDVSEVQAPPDTTDTHDTADTNVDGAEGVDTGTPDTSVEPCENTCSVDSGELGVCDDDDPCNGVESCS
ncbi:MAG: hypothetical protein VX938_12825, partial [Myxococcota bacterium]|nr:hypothetical protein [Myxococcota bacterium]